MKTHCLKKIVVLARSTALVLTPMAASAVYAQSEGVLVFTEADQKLITQVQDRVTERQLKNKAENDTGPIGKAREISANLKKAIEQKELERTASVYWAGMEAGVPKVFENRRQAKIAEAREAAQDAINLIQATVRHNAQSAAASGNGASGLVGDAASKVTGDLSSVEQEKKEYTAQLRDYVESVSTTFPELRHVLQEAGLTPGSVRELVIGRLRESNALLYEAGIAESNRIVWDNMARVIKARYANGGNPQAGTTPSAAEVIKASDKDKLFE